MSSMPKMQRRRHKRQRSSASSMDNSSRKPHLEAGTSMIGRVDLESAKLNPPSLRVQLDADSFGRVCITQISDMENWKTDPISQFRHQQFVRCCVLRTAGEATQQIELTMRPELLDAAPLDREALDTELEAAKCLPSEGELVKGYVCAVSKVGCFVRLTRVLTARVALKHLADHFVEDVAGSFPVGRMVVGRVLGTNAQKRQVELSLKPSVVVGVAGDCSSATFTWGTISKGQVVTGRVRKVETYGIFIDLDNSADLSGLCHISEASEEFVSDLRKLYTPGDVVKAFVVKVDKEKRRISLGLKASYFEGEADADNRVTAIGNFVEEEEATDEESIMEIEPLGDLAEQNGGMDEEEDDEEEEDEDDEDDEDDDEEDDDDDEERDEDKCDNGNWAKKRHGNASTDAASGSLQAALRAIHSSGNADEGVGDDDGGSDEEDEDGEEDPASQNDSKPRNSRAKAAARKREEAAIAASEARRLIEDGSHVPKSADAFERMLLARPNSSYLWIQYFSFRVAAAEFDRARAVAERALQTIHFREEKEKANVWSSYLQFEHEFGTDETLMSVFERMLQQLDPKELV